MSDNEQEEVNPDAPPVDENGIPVEPAEPEEPRNFLKRE